MGRKVIIRACRAGDIKSIIECNERNLPENYPREVWQALLQHREHSFVAIHGGEVVAYIVARDTTIVSLACDQNFRKYHIATYLMQHCMSTYPLDTILNLHCRVSNESALKLYTNHGFTVKETTPDYYNNPTESAHELTAPARKFETPPTKLNI